MRKELFLSPSSSSHISRTSSDRMSSEETLVRADDDEETPLLEEGGGGHSPWRRRKRLHCGDNHILSNLRTGAAPLVQLGMLIIVGLIGRAVVLHSERLTLISAHTLLNATGLLFATQAILVLQPTHSADQKRRGTRWHAVLHATGLLSLIGGLVTVEVDKFAHGWHHVRSPHAILGLVTYILLGILPIVGATSYWAPGLYGGADRARAVWKYHRALGYITFGLALATVCTALRTPYNTHVLGVSFAAVAAASGGTLAALLLRADVRKLGVGGPAVVAAEVDSTSDSPV